MNERGDFTAEVRLVGISAIAMTIGACCALAALVLLRLIDLFTNLFYFSTSRSNHARRRTTRWAGPRCWCRCWAG